MFQLDALAALRRNAVRLLTRSIVAHNAPESACMAPPHPCPKPLGA
jgi:hypothetical protein